MVQIIRHDFETGRDDTADVIPRARNDVERNRRAEIDHDRRDAVELRDRRRVRETVRADRARLRIFDANTKVEFRIKE